ncbi:MAG: hypothetical protein Q8S13_11285 [Dehalococcoidia bacterium]|nr:hypothetical protein [Dehalococcoidia bacterium]
MKFDLDPSWLPVALIVSLLLWYAYCTRQQVAVWHDDLTLWRHAVEQAPLKPRPRINYGLALLRSGRLDEAARAFRVARMLADEPHVPSWDRDDAIRAVDENLKTITALKIKMR